MDYKTLGLQIWISIVTIMDQDLKILGLRIWITIIRF